MTDLPEPFRSFMASGNAQEACDAEASGPQQLFARAMARVQVGRDREARADLEAAEATLGDAARIELAYLDIRERSALEDAWGTAREVLERAPEGSALQGRAAHVLGLAEGKRRNSQAAIDALLRASDIYRDLGDRAARAQVLDTLGMVFGAGGRLDHALSYYAMSLVAKTLVGDRTGMGITLGNIGRAHLRAGRLQDAIDCFELDLQLCERTGDMRGKARMHEDLGRTKLAAGEIDDARAELEECLRLAREHGYRDLQIFALKDLALAALESGAPDDGLAFLERAEALIAEGDEAYLQHLLLGVRGRYYLEIGDERAISTLEDAAKAYADAELPDLEIPLLITLARALTGRRYKASAEACLRRALRRAQADGYARYLPSIRESITSLGHVEGVAEEEGRLAAGPDEPPPTEGYTLLECVGEGAFGSVYRAFDPARNLIVALKRLRMESLYDGQVRRRLLASARLEWEAVSQLRHPGIARVYAVGTDTKGETYVVQEYVDGKSLRSLVPGAPDANPRLAIAIVQRIALALAVLHERGVVHRDLKPENILLRRRDESPVLVDFGIAHVPTLPEALGSNLLVGTLEYMAPEQTTGKPVDPKADIYALGVVLYECLTGLRPILVHGNDTRECIREIQSSEPVPIAEWRPGLGPDLERLVDDMLAKNPSRRPTAAEVARDCGLVAAFFG